MNLEVFFYVGLKLPIGKHTGILVPYPTKYSRKDVPLKVHTGKVDVKIKLPYNIDINSIKWFSVFNPSANEDCGHVIFPEILDQPGKWF